MSYSFSFSNKYENIFIRKIILKLYYTSPVLLLFIILELSKSNYSPSPCKGTKYDDRLIVIVYKAKPQSRCTAPAVMVWHSFPARCNAMVSALLARRVKTAPEWWSQW